jgi:hypothetical protein
MMVRAGWAALVLAAMAGCGGPLRRPEPSAPPAAAEHDAEWHWARREDPTHLRAAIALYRQEFDRKPSPALAARLGWAWFFLADYFLEGDPDARDAVHAEAARYVLAGLRLQPDVAAALGGRAVPTAAAIALVDAEHGAALFWWLAHFGRWLSHRNVVTQLAHAGRVVAAMERVQQLGIEVGPGALHRMWGAYYARRGDFRKAREHLDAASREAPHILYTRILYATECALPTHDKELFVQQLRLALDEKEPADPEWLPGFRLERERARRLLARVDELFPR